MDRLARVVAVVPALEEAPRIGDVVRGLCRALGPDDRVVVIDDGSADDTSAVARAVGDERVEVVRHAARRGVGAAIATGYLRAIALEADVAMPPSTVFHRDAPFGEAVVVCAAPPLPLPVPAHSSPPPNPNELTPTLGLTIVLLTLASLVLVLTTTTTTTTTRSSRAAPNV